MSSRIRNSTEKLKILCVDDDKIVLLASQAILGKRFSTQVARSGSEGLNALRIFQPDWVIVDLDWEGLSPLGMKGYLRKPIDIDKLMDIIEENP